MQVLCTGARELPDDYGPENLDSVIGAGCGLPIEVADEAWDIQTDQHGAVTRQHKQAYCPACGTATFVIRGS